YALYVIEKLFSKKDIVIMTGGTGLYVRAFCEGMDMIPAVEDAVREQVIKGYQQAGLPWLQQQLLEKDPAWAASGEMLNPQRAMRALEVRLQTGQSILQFQKEKKAERPFNIIKLGLQLPRPQLYAQINHRVELMMAEGLEEEARALQPYSALNALQTVGYSEMFDYFNGRLSLAEAVDEIKKHTRHYAKRQLTWFLKDSSIKWFSPLDHNQLINYLLKLV
ncbi:MAG TPA: tRNA (adenosine(37)-N6)-dimethylallyltransferase MiaA, partial [Chitinophagaceae bacterium]|nr:tRNA (adenosine(37)-N6)-dimethylallyltransferase MiaA [Chitinophagaceae bacterium]